MVLQQFKTALKVRSNICLTFMQCNFEDFHFATDYVFFFLSFPF